MYINTVHLFLGDDMASLAGAISSHVGKYGNQDIERYVHVLTCKNGLNGSLTIGETGGNDQPQEMVDDSVGSTFFNELFSRVIAIGRGVHEMDPKLYLCIYVQLYDTNRINELKNILKWVNGSHSDYMIDVYGISYDLAHVFCSSENERTNLIYQAEQNKLNTKQSINDIVDEYRSVDSVKRLLLMQNRNFKGIGLNLDIETVVRIFGEFAILTTEHYYDLFPVSSVDDYEINSFGISALWFNEFFYTKYFLNSSLIYLFEREGITNLETDKRKLILTKVKSLVEKYSSLFNIFYNQYVLPNVLSGSLKEENKAEIVDKFSEQTKQIDEEFQRFIDDKSLTIKEKKLILALMLIEDDELIEDDLLIDQSPSFDESLNDAVDLYVEENNKIVDDGANTVLSGPFSGNHVYNPISQLVALKKSIRKSKSFIRKSESRLHEIQEGITIDDDRRRVIVDGRFIFGDVTYKLLSDVVEEPLDETYAAKTTTSLAVDLRERFSPIRNQGGLGACSAFSSSSVFEYILNSIDSSSVHRLSPRFLYYNVCDKDENGAPIDNGASFYATLKSLGEMGICEESLCPYSENFSTPPSDEAVSDAVSRLVTKAISVNVAHNDITSALEEGYPVAISIRLFDSFRNNYSGFVFRPSDEEIANDNNDAWHAMVICGFSEKQKVYIVRNSWGDSFGDNGYCYIPFSYVEDSTLCRQACIITKVSCDEFHTGVVNDDVVFNEGSKEVEYATLRILIEEEKRALGNLERSYNQLYKQYVKLLSDLSHAGKRDIIREHALRKGKQTIETDNHSVSEETAKSSFLSILLPSIVLIVVLIADYMFVHNHLFSETAGWCISGVSLLAFVSYLLFGKKHSDSQAECATDVALTDNADSNLSVELRFRSADMVIDYLKKTRNQLELNHGKITSYLSSLVGWYNQTCGEREIICDDLKDPFVSVLAENDFKRIFKHKQDDFVSDVDLWDMFSEYETGEDRIAAFHDRLIERISNRIESFYVDFSMFRYLTCYNSDSDSLMYNENLREYLLRIECQSLPFAECSEESCQNRMQRLLVIKCEDSKDQREFVDYAKNNFTKNPCCCFGGTLSKLTYVQLIGLSRSQLKLYRFGGSEEPLLPTHPSDPVMEKKISVVI